MTPVELLTDPAATDSAVNGIMKALVYHGPGQRAWETKPKPTIRERGDAIVRITTSTICGTDLHILKGDVPSVTPGRVLGHEGVGVIEAISYGGASLAQSLIELDVVDDYRFLIHPVILGSGLPVFTKAKQLMTLELVKERRFPNGAVAHVYNRSAISAALIAFDQGARTTEDQWCSTNAASFSSDDLKPASWSDLLMPCGTLSAVIVTVVPAGAASNDHVNVISPAKPGSVDSNVTDCLIRRPGRSSRNRPLVMSVRAVVFRIQWTSSRRTATPPGNARLL